MAERELDEDERRQEPERQVQRGSTPLEAALPVMPSTQHARADTVRICAMASGHPRYAPAASGAQTSTAWSEVMAPRSSHRLRARPVGAIARQARAGRAIAPSASPTRLSALAGC